jgi:dipeptidyl aminopeptidase/acylaminoacyl peptidase
MSLVITRSNPLLLLATILLAGCAGGEDDTSSSGDDKASPNLIAYGVTQKDYGEIWVMDADGSNARRVTQAAPADRGEGNGATNPSLSPDGKRIVYAMEEGPEGEHSREIYVVGLDGGEPELFTNNVVRDDQPAWSPDGKRIVFMTGSDWPTPLLVIDVDKPGSAGTFIAHGIGPAWSPDSEQIAYATPRWSLTSVPAIYVVDATGGEPRLLVNGAVSPAWSPDGKRIAFTKSEYPCVDPCENGEIFTVNVDGTDLRRLTQTTEALDNAPAWSPDGTEIAFMSRAVREDVWEDYELFVMDANGSNVRRLTTNDTHDVEPDWR